MQTLGRWRNWLAERAVDTAGWKRAAECGQFAPGTTDRDRREPYADTGALAHWLAESPGGSVERERTGCGYCGADTAGLPPVLNGLLKKSYTKLSYPGRIVISSRISGCYATICLTTTVALVSISSA